MVSPVVATMVVGATTIEELRSDLGALWCSWTPAASGGSPSIKLTQMRSSVSQ
jgi:aryl-alcohol dehydrogenase-like predicted oxidoreductase